MFWKRETSKIEKAVEVAIERVLREHANATTEEIAALGTIRQLRAQKERLENEIAELKLQHRQEEREIEHKVGLAKLRQEAEAEIAYEKLEAREEQLEAEKEVAVKEARVAAREEAMARAEELQGEHLARMEKMVGVLVAALPKAEMLVEMSGGKARK